MHQRTYEQRIKTLTKLTIHQDTVIERLVNEREALRVRVVELEQEADKVYLSVD